MSTEAGPSRTLPCQEFVAPLPLLALGLLALNDHVLKSGLPAMEFLTGKLSDFAGLFFFPLLLTASWNSSKECARRWNGATPVLAPLPTTRQLAVSCGATGLVFAAIKLHADFGLWVASIMEAVVTIPFGFVADATDLIALAALPFAYLYGQRRAQQASARHEENSRG